MKKGEKGNFEMCGCKRLVVQKNLAPPVDKSTKKKKEATTSASESKNNGRRDSVMVGKQW